MRSIIDDTVPTLAVLCTLALLSHWLPKGVTLLELALAAGATLAPAAAQARRKRRAIPDDDASA